MSTDHHPIDSGKLSVALVSMPWSIYNRPSIQLGTLKSYLRQQDPFVRVDCFHHYLTIARAVDPETYHWLTLSGWAGESLYSPILFPEKSEEAEALFEKECKRFKRKKEVPGFGFLTQHVKEALHDWIQSISWKSYDLVGFSVCFNQLLPSLAAAHLIKEKTPTLRIVFGGSACGGKCGSDLQKNFSQVDHVVRGEGEKGLYKLVRALQDTDKEAVAAIIDSEENCDLKEAPAPDYQDYFNELETVFFDMPVNPVIPVEFSRGCWWGKCAFCNLNLQWCGYRFKTAAQLFSELVKMSSDFSCLDFSFTDNVLPVNEARKFFRNTAAVREDYGFFAEIRATQKDDLALYRRGGIKVVQAGIESLSSSLLVKMNKGVSVIENLAVMKTAQQEGIKLEGNLITEFPGSNEKQVQETLECLEFALPYQPLTAAAFFLGLDSPVDQVQEKYSIKASGPHKNYAAMYPHEIIRDQEMLIKNHIGSRKIQRKMWRPVTQRVKKWHEFHRKRSNVHFAPLTYRDGGDFMIIRQEQIQGPLLSHKLRGFSRKIYLFCEDVQELGRLEEEFPMFSYKNLLKFLNGMIEKKLMFREGDRLISLAIQSRYLTGNKE